MDFVGPETSIEFARAAATSPLGDVLWRDVAANGGFPCRRRPGWLVAGVIVDQARWPSVARRAKLCVSGRSAPPLPPSRRLCWLAGTRAGLGQRQGERFCALQCNSSALPLPGRAS